MTNTKQFATEMNEKTETTDGKQYPKWALAIAPKNSIVYRLFLGPDPLHVRRKIYLMTFIIVAFNVSVWVAASLLFKSYPSLIGTARG
jgi:hypothetical protein